MNEKIEKIKSLSGAWMDSYFFPPASDNDISEYEKKNNIIIPESYKKFLLLTNGARIFGSDIYLYGVSGEIKYYLNFDFTEDQIPNQLLILGYYNDKHICYDYRDDIYIFTKKKNMSS